MTGNPFYVRTDRERRDVEDPSINYAIRRGWWHTKVGALTMDSLPDDLFVRDGQYVWWEFKKKDEEPTKKQASRHREMRAMGMDVRWTDNFEQFRQEMV